MKVLRLQTFKQLQTVWMQQLIARTDMPSKLTTGHETDSKNKTVCQQWALAITVSFATSCPHSLRVSQLYPLALLILQTAEFHFQEKKKKICSDFLQSSGTRHWGTNVNGWRKKKWNTTKLHDPGREPKNVCGPVTVIATAEGHWHECNHVMFIVSLPEMKARVKDQSICLKLDSQNPSLLIFLGQLH